MGQGGSRGGSGSSPPDGVGAYLEQPRQSAPNSALRASNPLSQGDQGQGGSKRSEGP
jgi:hypothetical protein